MKKLVKNSNLWLSLIILVFFALHIPLLNNPYHYDALVFVSQAKYLLQNGLLSIPVEDFGHPYFLFWVLAFFYYLLGESVVVSHTVILIFAIIGIIVTYLIGKELFNEKIALLATAFLSLQPWFFIVSSWTYLDVPLASLFTVSVYFFVKSIKTSKLKYYLLFAIFASLTVLTKAPGILIVALPIAYILTNKDFKRKNILFLLPLFVMLLWYLWYYSQTGYFVNPILGSKVTFPTSLANIFLIGKNFSSNVFFILIENGNFIGLLVITYALITKRYKYVFLFLGILFFVFAPYSFELKEPEFIFYPLLFLSNLIFISWFFKIRKIKNEYKLLFVWIGAVMLYAFFAQLSFRYGLLMLPPFALLFAASIENIKRGSLILGIVFILLFLQVFNYSNYYSQRDLIYNNIFDYFSDKNPESVMVAYPIATPAVLSVKEIDSRPLEKINVVLTPENKEEFDKTNPQFLVVDERSVNFEYPYIQDIVKTNSPEISFSKEINWYTYYGVRKVFVNRLHIYRLN